MLKPALALSLLLTFSHHQQPTQTTADAPKPAADAPIPAADAAKVNPVKATPASLAKADRKAHV